MKVSKRLLRKVYIAVALVVAAYVVQQFDAATQQGEARTSAGIEQSGAGGQSVEQAFAARAESLLLTAEGRVKKTLADDTKEPRHQRFILELPSGHTVLVAHNIDLADRIAGLRTGDKIRLRGDYEWNPEGGVIHWTHHDPRGRREGGWIEYAGTVYQ